MYAKHATLIQSHKRTLAVIKVCQVALYIVAVPLIVFTGAHILLAAGLIGGTLPVATRAELSHECVLASLLFSVILVAIGLILAVFAGIVLFVNHKRFARNRQMRS